MERGNTKHSRHLDNEMAREAREQNVVGSRVVQERPLPEPDAEDEAYQPRLYGEVTGPSMPTPEEIDGRSELGRWIPRTALPGDRDALVEVVREAGAPDGIVAQIEALPPGEEYETVVQIWGALGHENEARESPIP